MSDGRDVMCPSRLRDVMGAPYLLQGLVDAVGVSNYGPKQLQKISQ